MIKAYIFLFHAAKTINVLGLYKKGMHDMFILFALYLMKRALVGFHFPKNYFRKKVNQVSVIFSAADITMAVYF